MGRSECVVIVCTCGKKYYSVPLMGTLKFKQPPEKPEEYIAQLGRNFWREWQWHTAPIAVSTDTSVIQVADYSVDLASKVKMWLLRSSGVSLLNQFDDQVALLDFSFASLESLTHFHAGKQSLSSSIEKIREYLKTVLERQEILMLSAHPNYNHTKAVYLKDLAPLKNQYAHLCAVKGMIPSKKYNAFATWLLDGHGRIEQLLQGTQPLLLHPPDDSIERYLFGFRKHIASILQDQPLTRQLREDLASKVISRYEEQSTRQFALDVHQLKGELGIADIFDTDDLRPTIDRLKKLASTCPVLYGKIEIACRDILLKLAGEKKLSKLRRETLVDTGNFWCAYLQEKNMPIYEHKEFGLAFLAAILRVNPKDDVLQHLGAIE